MQICATSFCLLLVATSLATTQSRSQNNEGKLAREVIIICACTCMYNMFVWLYRRLGNRHGPRM